VSEELTEKQEEYLELHNAQNRYLSMQKACRNLTKAVRKGYFPGVLGKAIGPGLVLLETYSKGIEVELAKVKEQLKNVKKDAKG